MDANAVVLHKVVTILEVDVARWDQLLVAGHNAPRLAGLWL
jgi:hypothetical protein